MEWKFWNKKGEEKRNNAQELQYLTPAQCGEALTFGQIFNRYSAMNISAVFAATNLIANTIASLPIKVLINDEKGNNVWDNHTVNISFNNPNNGNISQFTLIKLIIQSVILKGNAFVLIQRDGEGNVKSLKFVESQDVTINYDKIKGKLSYTVNYQPKTIEPKDMLHFILNSYDGVNGVSIISYAARTIGITNSSENSAKAFFDNGMNVNGLLKVNSPISQQQKMEIRQSWQQAYNGNGGGLAIINGNMDYQQLTLNPSDSQLLESRNFNVSDIARFFNINPLLIGGQGGASYASLEMLENAFLVHTLQPYITMIESELNRKLLRPIDNNLSIIIETNELLRTEKDKQANYYKTMIDSGILTRNEVRKELGYGEIEGGDVATVAYSDIHQNTVGNTDQNNDKSDNKE